MAVDDVEWNQTMWSMNAAGFPHDQLLDFLPDTSKPWVFRPDEWNNTWSAQCSFGPVTPIEVAGSGNYRAGSWFDQLPELYEIIPQQFLDNHSMWLESATSVGNSSCFKDMLMFSLLTIRPLAGRNMSIFISAIHLHEAPAATNVTSPDATFGIGPVGASSYTTLLCDLSQSPSSMEHVYVAYPDISYTPDDTFAMALTTHYQATLVQQSRRGWPITVPSGQDMWRFYQAYLISKDTQNYLPVTRVLSIQTPTVELSSIFLVLTLFIMMLIAAGWAYHSFFVMLHGSLSMYMLKTKLDWLLQSLREAMGVNNAAEAPSERPYQHTDYEVPLRNLVPEQSGRSYSNGYRDLRRRKSVT